MKSPCLSCRRIGKSKIVCSKKCPALSEFQTFLDQPILSKSPGDAATLPYFLRYIQGTDIFFDPLKDQFF